MPIGLLSVVLNPLGSAMKKLSALAVLLIALPTQASANCLHTIKSFMAGQGPDLSEVSRSDRFYFSENGRTYSKCLMPSGSDDFDYSRIWNQNIKWGKRILGNQGSSLYGIYDNDGTLFGLHSSTNMRQREKCSQKGKILTKVTS